MKQRRISDNTVENKTYFSTITNLTERIADKTLGQLEKEGVFVFPEFVSKADDITADQMILQETNDSYQTSNVMGVVGYGDERLVITSRFINGEKDYFLEYMLDKVMDFPNIVDFDTDSDMDSQFFHLLLFLFPRYLKRAMRKGVYKTYIRRRYNDENVKGTIDIARHIKENTPFIGKIAYSQREYSYDNYLTELIRHTIEFIKGKPYGHRLLGKVRDEVCHIIDATPEYRCTDIQKVIVDNKQNTVRHAYYREYRNLQRLCLLILQHESNNIGTGSRTIYGILFDGAWLWEEYIDSLVDKKFYHPMNKAGKDAQQLFSSNTGKRGGVIYPDFISRDSEPRIIADAKYKPIDNIGNRDYLQVLAYMFRFGAKKGFYFYPESEGNEDCQLWMNKGTTYEGNVEPRDDISVIKHGLRIPSETTYYGDFKRRMEAYEISFLDEISKEIIDRS